MRADAFGTEPCPDCVVQLGPYGRVMGLMDPLMITPLIFASSLLAGRIFDVTGDHCAVFDMFFGALLLAGLLLTRLQPITKHSGETPW